MDTQALDGNFSIILSVTFVLKYRLPAQSFTVRDTRDTR
jgi:hypothetical protein